MAGARRATSRHGCRPALHDGLRIDGAFGNACGRGVLLQPGQDRRGDELADDRDAERRHVPEIVEYVLRMVVQDRRGVDQLGAAGALAGVCRDEKKSLTLTVAVAHGGAENRKYS